MGALDGVRVVVTRAADQAEELARPLRAHGGEPILLPMIEIAPPENFEPLRRAARFGDYDWIIFTSANGVRAFAAELPHPVRSSKARVAAVGAATRSAAQRDGFTVTLMPEKYVAESLVDAFRDIDLNGRRILIPSAAVTRDVVPIALRKRGATVDVVEAYRNIIPREAAERAEIVFQEPFPHWVTFASSSAVENLIRVVRSESLRLVKIATIGPITSATVRKYDLHVDLEAGVQTVNGLVQALCTYREKAGSSKTVGRPE